MEGVFTRRFVPHPSIQEKTKGGIEMTVKQIIAGELFEGGVVYGDHSVLESVATEWYVTDGDAGLHSIVIHVVVDGVVYKFEIRAE